MASSQNSREWSFDTTPNPQSKFIEAVQTEVLFSLEVNRWDKDKQNFENKEKAIKKEKIKLS